MSLLQKIHNIRAKGLTVVKTGKITGGINARFASYPDVWAAVSPALTDEGLSVGFTSAVISFQHETELVRMTMTVSDGTTQEDHQFDMIVPEKILNSRGSSVTNNSQRVANAESYCKRTSLILFFGMSAGNEDEVERMAPTPDQSNIPGIIMVTESTPWQGLMDGMWADVMAPTQDGKLGDAAKRGNAAMRQMWQDYPHHPGLCAWAADGISNALQENGWGWKAEILAIEGALPESMQACNPVELALAARVLRKALSEIKGDAK
jgi:hypothetical protein